MTSLIGWVSVDHRQPSGLYFASDSRISWGSKAKIWDSGRKVFASRTTPDIFAFCGEVLFPTQALGSFIDLMDSGVLFDPETTASHRHERFCQIVRTAHRRSKDAPEEDFTIIHGARDGTGMAADFRLWKLSYSAKKQRWSHQALAVPTDYSQPILIEGTGRSSVEECLTKWEESKARGTSRAIFSAFCDALAAAKDSLSGGAPQLVGLYRKWPGLTFGTLTEGTLYLHGLVASKYQHRSVYQWRNELFEIIDPVSGNRASGAQEHERPFPRLG